MTFWDFASQHYVAALFGLFIVSASSVAAVREICNAIKRPWRSRDIQTHGWPVPPLDSDGDIHWDGSCK